MAYHCQLSTVPISSSLLNRPGPLITGNMEFAKVLITWEYSENPGDDMPSSKMWKPMTPTVASIIRHASDYGTLFSWNLLDREAGRPFWLYHLERTNTAIGAAIVVRATQATGHAVLAIANRHLQRQNRNQCNHDVRRPGLQTGIWIAEYTHHVTVQERGIANYSYASSAPFGRTILVSQMHNDKLCVQTKQIATQ